MRGFAAFCHKEKCYPFGILLSYAGYLSRFAAAHSSDPTHVGIFLGTNDFAAGITDASYATYKAYLDAMISGIQTDVPGTVVLICLPPQGALQSGFGAAYGAGYSEGQFANNMNGFIRRILADYDSAAVRATDIYLVPFHVNLDRYTGYPMSEEVKNIYTTETVNRCTDGVHPSTGVGHKMMADTLAAVIQATR